MSQEPELVEDRRISGKGLLKVNPDVKKIRYFTLYADVIREPTNKYLNLNYNPPKSRYATLTFLLDDYVQFEHPMEYSKQRWDLVADVTSQNLIALKCVYDGILKSFANLGTALNVVPVSITDKIKDYEYLVLLFNEIRVVCYGDTAIQLKLYTTANDTCDPDKDTPRKPPPPPPPDPLTPPGLPVPNISLPYNPDPQDPDVGDDGNTNPTPIDKNIPIPDPPLPPGTELFWNFSTRRNPRTARIDAVFGPVGLPISDYSVTSGNVDLSLNAREWSGSFTSGGSRIYGSAVGDDNPEDKPKLYLWVAGDSSAPYKIISPS